MTTRRSFYYGRFAVLGIAAIFAFTFVVMWLWNWLIPDIFNGPELAYWQTLGLLILSKIIFSGIGGRGSSHHRPSYSHSSSPCGPGERWRKKYEEKMNGKMEETSGETSGDTSGEKTSD